MPRNSYHPGEKRVINRASIGSVVYFAPCGNTGAVRQRVEQALVFGYPHSASTAVSFEAGAEAWTCVHASGDTLAVIVE
jgi:hypothetical protein